MNQVNNAPANFFTELGNTKPYFKAAFEGFAGTGKTFTMAEVAIGLHKRIGSTKPIVIFDTEKAAKFLVEQFSKAGIQGLVRESKSLADLQKTMEYMRTGASEILIIDSITHVWEDVLAAYARKVGRTRLQFQDWGILKPTWKTEFSQPFVQDNYHIIMSGRAGYEYDNELNEETGKRELVKTGVKMKVEGETAYEPDLLVLMNRYQEMKGNELVKTVRTATVVKDRSTKIDGKIFENPTYNDFSPAIEVMLGGNHIKKDNVVAEGDTQFMFRTEEEKADWKRERDGLIERLTNLLKKIYPGATGKDAQSKIEVLDFIFGTSSETEISQMRPNDLKKSLMELADHLVGLGVAKYVTNSIGQKIIVRADDVKEAPKTETAAPAAVATTPKKKKAE